MHILHEITHSSFIDVYYSNIIQHWPHWRLNENTSEEKIGAENKI